MMYKEEILLNILLQDWNLLTIVKLKTQQTKHLSQIKIIAFKEKNEWNLQAKYNIGKKVVKEETKSE